METLTLDTLLELDTFIHGNSALFEYHMNHTALVKEYATILNQRLGNEFDNDKLIFIAFAHDLFKEHSLDPTRTVTWNGIDIPQDTNRYVRMNVDVLDRYGLGEYFNTDIQLHPLAAGIFLIKEFGIEDEEILYPVFFHSCPIISIYEKLPEKTRGMVDLIMLADKLSSNYLRINFKHLGVRADLDLAIFGPDGKEFNYTTGLVLARVIGQGKSKEIHSVEATEYYYKRLLAMNPFVPKSYDVRRLGVIRKWQPRKSPVLPTQLQISKM